MCFQRSFVALTLYGSKWGPDRLLIASVRLMGSPSSSRMQCHIRAGSSR
jgi:hypothetical protein